MHQYLVPLFISLAIASPLSQSYSSLLSGDTPLTPESFESLYSSFQALYRSSPNNDHSLFLQSNPHVDRRQVFNETLQAVLTHNKDPRQTYKKGINQFSDFTFPEFQDYFSLKDSQSECSATSSSPSEVPPRLSSSLVPEFWDWRDVGGVSPVKNQARCGSCWAFSTVGALESHFLIDFGQFKNLSERQLLDCSWAYDNHGCKGGLPSHAFEYVFQAGGITTEAQYPYSTENATYNCNEQGTVPEVTVLGSVNITQGDEEELRDAVFLNGPVSVAYEVIDGFKDYESGIYTSTECGEYPSDVNHAVLAVGFGHDYDLDMDYWIVKNSWSDHWGDHGYFKIQRGVNMCAIAQCNSYPKGIRDITPQLLEVHQML